jgi:hypothetical protein
MTRKYQKRMRSTTAFLEMKESDIVTLGQGTLSERQLPKHMIPPYPQPKNLSSSSYYLSPYMCEGKIKEHQLVTTQQIDLSNGSDFKNFCLLAESN